MGGSLQGSGALGLAALLFALYLFRVALVLVFERLQIVLQIVQVAHALLVSLATPCARDTSISVVR